MSHVDDAEARRRLTDLEDWDVIAPAEAEEWLGEEARKFAASVSLSPAAVAAQMPRAESVDHAIILVMASLWRAAVGGLASADDLQFVPRWRRVRDLAGLSPGQLAEVLSRVRVASRRLAKRRLRELGLHGWAEELDAALAAIQVHPHRAWIEQRAAELVAARMMTEAQIAAGAVRSFDDWIIGEGLESPGRWYVLHVAEPMFLAEIWDEDEAPIEGLSWSLSNGQVAGNLVWLADQLPPTEIIDRWMLGLGRVLDDYDTRVARRNERLGGADAGRKNHDER